MWLLVGQLNHIIYFDIINGSDVLLRFFFN